MKRQRLKGREKPLFSGKMVIARKEDMSAFGAYISPSFSAGEGLICLNLSLMAMGAIEDRGALANFKRAFEDTLAHELLHVAQEVYGAVFSETGVECALKAARKYKKKHGSPLSDDIEVYNGLLQAQLDVVVDAARKLHDALPAKVKRSAAMTAFHNAIASRREIADELLRNAAGKPDAAKQAYLVEWYNGDVYGDYRTEVIAVFSARETAKMFASSASRASERWRKRYGAWLASGMKEPPPQFKSRFDPQRGDKANLDQRYYVLECPLNPAWSTVTAKKMPKE